MTLPGCDDAVITDLRAAQDDAVCADPDIIADLDGRSLILHCGKPALSAVVMVMVVDLNIRRELDIIAEDDLLMADDHIIGVEGDIFARTHSAPLRTRSSPRRAS